jgi:CRISPR-associated endonuclease Cas2
MSRATFPLRTWLVCYDVHAPRARRRIALLLEGEGIRVQRSVFQVEATPHQIERLRRRCLAWMRDGDKLFIEAISGSLPLPWLPRPRQGLPTYWVS